MLSRFLAYFLWLIATQSYAAIEVVDDNDDLLRLQQPASRIISLSPNITEVLFYIGAGSQIVGADEYSNYPPQALQITRVNNHAAANYELILSLKPDLVIAWQSGNGEKIIKAIRALGIPVFVVETRQLNDIPSLFKRLGQLSGQLIQAQQRATEFTQRLEKLRELNRAKSPIRTFYQVWSEPLITLNGQHIVSNVIELCGGVNVFADAVPLAPYVNIESVLVADPQVIITGASQEQQSIELGNWQQWDSLSAVKNQHIYAISGDLMQRHSSRILDGAQLLCGYMDRARSAKKSQKGP